MISLDPPPLLKFLSSGERLQILRRQQKALQETIAITSSAIDLLSERTTVHTVASRLRNIAIRNIRDNGMPFSNFMATVLNLLQYSPGLSMHKLYYGISLIMECHSCSQWLFCNREFARSQIGQMGRKGKDKAVFDLPKAFTSHLNLDEALLIIALAFRRKATE
ncbi:hypothetical protein BCV71DRAFT_283090, partial [Rhizopus microsporus]